MRNWSTDEERLKKHPAQYDTWKLEQLLNFGLGGEKVSTEELKEQLPRITLDPARRKFLELLLYGS